MIFFIGNIYQKTWCLTYSIFLKGEEAEDEEEEAAGGERGEDKKEQPPKRMQVVEGMKKI